MSDRVIFLDIDGVLLAGRAWLLPENRKLYDTTRGLARCEANLEAGRAAVFDVAAVALVDRVCAVTDARLVISSNWRYTVGPGPTRNRLEAHGIGADRFHHDWACPCTVQGAPQKSADIRRWLDGHPGVEDWLVLDDQQDVVPGRTLAIDPVDGLGVRDAAAAVRWFGSADPALGVRPLSRADIDMVNAAFGEERVAAARWLEAADTRVPRRDRPSALPAGPRRGEGLNALERATAEAATARLATVGRAGPLARG